MDSKCVSALLEECLRAAAEESTQLSETCRTHYRSCRDSLCVELASLLQEAVEMKWPFVPEKWQYKKSVSLDDKTNLSDLIRKHLPQLLALLKASIVAREPRSALAVVFLVDRFLYWIDESSRLLKIAKLLHRRHRDIAIAPQLVIRQARVYLNSGKLQKAECILSCMINNSGAAGSWEYQSEKDRVLVQAVSVQVRGMILQKLGLWLDAAELIWASVVGYFALPEPDKKGIGASLGILANILVSMNMEDFEAFRTNPNMDFSLLGNASHRLLLAAQAAKMAVIYSEYTSLYVLTNVVTQGTCLLSYSFSMECPPPQRQPFLLQAKEAFEIGLLSKAKGELVTSQQELHTFIKAAYSLSLTNKWLGIAPETLAQATQACQNALANLYQYCHTPDEDKDDLCTMIMTQVANVKVLLQVEPFLNSDIKSFIPDSYKHEEGLAVKFTFDDFSKIIQKFQKYHESLSTTNEMRCKGGEDETDGGRLYLTALWTTMGTLDTDRDADNKKLKDDPKPEMSDSPRKHFPVGPELVSTLGSAAGSSGQNGSDSIGGSAGKSGEEVINHCCGTTETDGEMIESPENMKKNSQGHRSGVRSLANPLSPGSCLRSPSDRLAVMQADIVTLDTEDNMETGVGGQGQEEEGTPHVQSLSQLALITSSSSLGDSFGSQSSWEKISAVPRRPSSRETPPLSLSNTRGSQSSKSHDSDDGFSLLETVNSDFSDLGLSSITGNSMSGSRGASEPGEGLSANPYTNRETGYHAIPKDSPNPCASTDTSTESSFEVVDEPGFGQQHDEAFPPKKQNPQCYCCLNHCAVVHGVAGEQLVLSKEDHRALLAGVCHECLMERFQNQKALFQIKSHGASYNALRLKFSKGTGLWTATETCVYIGDHMGAQGTQRAALWVQFLHQEERLSSYVGKDYLKPKEIKFHLKDVERQMTAQHYVTEFNKSLYEKEVLAQIFYIPSEALLVLDGDVISGCLSVEPYMLGDFVKLTNNTGKKVQSFQATQYALAFGHFTYLLSARQEVVVDLQGWVTANGKGLTYLTDPQIHSTRTPKGPSNFAERGLRYFVEEQHGPECNGICRLLQLPSLGRWPNALP